ncbi:hypothetical protein CLOSTHATH_02433 [Hungatella hathewayi DSM 13479]|uniref:Uncharacterized protein n=1 Tax=Hungatella hathewayi DSM 13479 TaxID=566550 RepID=D3AFP9_9FIRM|nr:hypothetical protein CLOSTHATH_02433 [Hungatella hathewayi DSM 13479]
MVFLLLFQMYCHYNTAASIFLAVYFPFLTQFFCLLFFLSPKMYVSRHVAVPDSSPRAGKHEKYRFLLKNVCIFMIFLL